MSLLSSLKRALGRSNDDEEEDDYIAYSSSSDSDNTSGNKSENDETKATSHVDVVSFSDTDELPEGIFDGLVEVVNANLSPMVLKCLDVEAEKRYLYETLGSKFKDFIKATREKSLDYARGEWEREKSELNSRIADYKERCDTAENEMQEMKAVKVSEERQKQALKERVRNLEDKVAAAEAEKEQFDLENKSLLNKLKVSQVKTGAYEEAEAEIVELKAEIARMKAQPLDGYVPADELKALEDEFKGKNEVNNALINELRAEAAKNKEELDAKDAEATELKKRLEESQASHSELQAELETVNKALEDTRAELNEASASLSMLDSIQEQLDKVADFKKKKEDELAELREKLLAVELEKAQVVEAGDAQLKELEAANAELSKQLDKAEALLKERAAKDAGKAEEAKAVVENLELQLQSASDKIQEQERRISELESSAEEYNERIGALSQENTDTLELLHKKEELLEKKKIEVDSVKAEYDALKVAYEAEVNKLKTDDVEKTNKFQAEIAELQARLNVNGKIDDFLVDDDLRHAVEETFDVNFEDSGFEEFESVEEEAKKEDVKEIEPVVTADEPDELDDIDWLIPDTVESIQKEAEIKQAAEAESLKEEQGMASNDAQMSLFG